MMTLAIQPAEAGENSLDPLFVRHSDPTVRDGPLPFRVLDSALTRWCTNCSEQLPDDARFCPACGHSVAGEEESTVLDAIGIEFSRELRHITAVFCDLVGSTELSATMDTEEFSELIERYQQSAVSVVRAFGGDVEGYSGDGMLFRFGWPQAHDDDAVQRTDRRTRCRRRHHEARRQEAACHPSRRPQRPGGRRSARWRRPSGHHVFGRDAQRVRAAPGGRRTGHGGGQRGDDCPGRRQVRGHATRTPPTAGSSPSPSPPFVCFGQTGARSRMEVSANRRSPSRRAGPRAQLAEPALGPGQGRAGRGRTRHRGARSGQVQARSSAPRSDRRRRPTLGGNDRARHTPG